ncbi:hypothetical protein FRC17_000365 [Serendipita sp. 399]|nr:hypothetical protein FRC17_000365 [Serendipita sp. 399]
MHGAGKNGVLDAIRLLILCILFFTPSAVLSAPISEPVGQKVSIVEDGLVKRAVHVYSLVNYDRPSLKSAENEQANISSTGNPRDYSHAVEMADRISDDE